MNNKARALILSLVILVLCLALSIGGTYALFSSTVSTKVHLASGSLSLGFERVGYQECVLDDYGTLTVSEKSTAVTDLTQDGNKVFNIAKKAVPGSWYQTDFRVTRQGNVAIDYSIQIVLSTTDSEGNELTQAEIADQDILASQIKITVSSASLTDDVTFMLSDVIKIEEVTNAETGEVTQVETYQPKEIKLGSIYADEAASRDFTVKVEFVDDDDINNEAQSKDLSFDVIANAVQKTTKTTTNANANA